MGLLTTHHRNTVTHINTEWHFLQEVHIANITECVTSIRRSTRVRCPPPFLWLALGGSYVGIAFFQEKN